MGGLLHLFDFNQGSMARKIYSQKRHVDGLEAPRNSLELPIETSQSYYAMGDSVLYTNQVKEEWSEKSHYPTKASMKKLIKEEISKRPNTRHNAPSIVARLMGIDVLPLDTKPVVQAIEKKNENRKKERIGKGSLAQAPFNSNYSQKMDAFQLKKGSDPDRSCSSLKSGKLRPREHPQEEELQKFKKDFEAWQAARFRECSRVVELGNIPRSLHAQKNFNNEKVALYADSGRKIGEKPIKLKGNPVKPCSNERGGSQHHGYNYKNDTFLVDKNESFSSRSKTISKEFERFPQLNSGKKLDKSSAPTRIVILKPGPDKIGNYEEPWASSSGTSEERGTIEDFLEEVKARLKYEMQGKALRRGTVVRGGGIETPFSEKPSNPKQIAQHIAKQVRESVTRDLGMNLLRSESTRSYRSEIQFNGPGSPEFINRDTRRFLSERLRNVLKRETHQDIPGAVGGSSRTSMHEDGWGRLEQTGDTSKTGNEVSCWENVSDEQDMQTGSFRCGPDDDGVLHREFSPRNLIRSLSAPVSGTSFGKLLLEDRHILTGAHIRRKHEAIENVSVDVKTRKKEKFSFREKVSNFRYSLTLRGRLFGRKIQSVAESYDEHDFMNEIMSGPTVVLNLGDRHENSTEVPPSPASVCSSVHEEVWRSADPLSPISTPDLSSVEDHSIPQVFREISSNLNELRRQLNQLESDDSKDTPVGEEPSETELAELEDQAEAYTRDLLIASGLYDQSSDKTLSRWDPLAKPISNHVFEEVEESYKKLVRENEGSMDEPGEKQVEHKVLLDLLNEALCTVLGPPVTMSGFMRKVLGHTTVPPPCGRKLLDCVWEIMRVYVYPPTDRSHYSFESLLARDLGSAPFSGLTNDEVSVLGKEMEHLIFGDLIEEIVKEIQ
ncbi:uncharacterized protein LOC131151599 [Malania oleifera]|uniref:uncharacterized protein LOC131151599 n=1 Tax=Malania oleifera TaxID=397392 RepID=UPI0025ADD1BB|nr:uncharacterized protein LOC131151599 [Malania oleifera]XP_057958850.1 uncharacterized protein LOC131151599 [Malania oleifera]XP_057958858.1 uncharacterized protein LOC131151599 [Malania oleifera]